MAPILSAREPFFNLPAKTRRQAHFIFYFGEEEF